MAGTDELVEFQALSLKVSERTATNEERARWRELRVRLAPPPPPPAPPKQPRKEVRSQRKLKVAFAPLTALHATFTEEVSAGGVRLRVQGHLEPGTPMVLRLELGPPGPLTLTAHVAWCRRDDGGHFWAGIDFDGLRDEERERLEAWTSITAPPTTART